MVLVEFRSYLEDQLASISALTLWFGHMTCKIVPDMTCNVFGGTLNLAQSTNLFALEMLYDKEPHEFMLTLLTCFGFKFTDRFHRGYARVKVMAEWRKRSKSMAQATIDGNCTYCR